VQIVNATSVPEVALSVNGQPFYPKFPQGLYTGDAPTELLRVRYTITEPKKGLTVETNLVFPPSKHSTVLITGDFTTNRPFVPLAEPLPGNALATNKTPPPYVVFTVLSHDLAEGEAPLRYRFFNGMKERSVRISAPNDSPREILPGTMTVYSGQKPMVEFESMVGEVKIPVLIRQEGLIRNCLVVFYEKNGKPTFMRAFENHSSMSEKPPAEE
jgi:hypothetical protein